MSVDTDFVVFLSYSSLDGNLLFPLEQAIAGLDGVRVWSDSLIRPGDAIHPTIAEAIGQSHCILVLYTAAAARSVEVREELVRGDERRLPVIVLKEASVEEKVIPHFLRDRRHLVFDQNAMDLRRLTEEVKRAVLDVKARSAPR